MEKEIKLLTNKLETHREKLLDLIKSADEIIFAVGFFKKSGLKNIKEYLKKFCKDKTKTATFYIGIGLGETDPDSLEELHKIIKGKINLKLILCTPDAGIFHPKIYIFRTGEEVIIVVGSSNLTQHGWVVNDEASIVIKTSIKSSIFQELNLYFKQLYQDYYTEDIEELINYYKQKIEEHKDKYGNKSTFKFSREKSTVDTIDLPRLLRYYEIYKNSDEYVQPSDREVQYEKAKDNLNILASSIKLNGKQFHDLFGPLVGHKKYKPKLWHSGSIHRKTYATLNYPDGFRKLVRKVKYNLNEKVSSAYDNTIDLLNKMRKAKEISGIGENIVTEMFLSYNSKKFANLNDNPLAVLEMLGKVFPDTTSFKGNDYFEYVKLLAKIREELGMKSFLEIDSFFNFVYWNLIEE